MKILGIETSCDETAAAVVEDGKKVLAGIVSSQIDIHSKFGGVVPELASRAHLKLLCPVIEECLRSAELCLSDIDAVAVTAGPGLAGALLVGISTAKAISFSLKKPMIGINHIEAHLYTNFMNDEPSFPAVGLVISGGHTDLVYMSGIEEYHIMGRTRDDAVGEAFDKVAKMLNLGYPGGPVIDRIAAEGSSGGVVFPRPYMPGSFDFSFSGLKTAVLYHIKKYGCDNIEEIVSGFQEAVVDVLADKVLRAAEEKEVNTILLAGGVAGNSAIRKRIEREAMDKGLKFFCPVQELCTDNAVMVAGLGYVKLNRGGESSLSLNACSNWKLGEEIS